MHNIDLNHLQFVVDHDLTHYIAYTDVDINNVPRRIYGIGDSRVLAVLNLEEHLDELFQLNIKDSLETDFNQTLSFEL